MFGQPKSQYFNKDDSKTVFNHCLLHLISLRGLDVKANAKIVFKTEHQRAKRD